MPLLYVIKNLTFPLSKSIYFFDTSMPLEMKLYVLSLFETIRQINVHFPFSPLKKYGKTTDSLAFKKPSSDNLYFFKKSIVLIFFASFRLDCTYMLRRKLQFVNRCKIGLFYEHSVIPITCYAYMAVAVEFINFL